MAAIPRDREKNIWPPTVDSTEKNEGASLINTVVQGPTGNEHVLQAFHCAVQGAGADDADDQQDEQGGHAHGADLFNAAADALSR